MGFCTSIELLMCNFDYYFSFENNIKRLWSNYITEITFTTNPVIAHMNNLNSHFQVKVLEVLLHALWIYKTKEGVISSWILGAFYHEKIRQPQKLFWLIRFRYHFSYCHTINPLIFSNLLQCMVCKILRREWSITQYSHNSCNSWSNSFRDGH